MKPIIIVVDAIIGSGKTTLIRECLLPGLSAKGFRVTEVREPVEKWKENGRLAQFYQNPGRRGYQFQTMAFHDRICEARETYGKCMDTDIFLLERSIFTDILFMKVLYESGAIDKTEHDDYLDLWTMWKYLMPFEPDLFLYLRPAVETCMQRLKERNRDAEAGVTEEYQRLLLQKHDEFLSGEMVNIGTKLVPRLLLNGDSNFRDDAEVKEAICNIVEQQVKMYS